MADIPSIFGSDINSRFKSLRFKKLLIFFINSSIPFLSKTLDKESIGLRCFTFLNLLDGVKPILLLRSFNFFKKLNLFSNLIASVFI